MSKQNPESDFQYDNKHRIKPADEPCGLDGMMAGMGYYRVDRTDGNVEYRLEEKDPIDKFLEQEADQANPADCITQPKFKLGDIVHYIELQINKYTPSAEFSIWKCKIVWISWDGGEYNYILHNLFDNERLDGQASEFELYKEQEEAVNYAIQKIKDYYGEDKE